MENVVYYPDIVNQNLTHGDPKGHYKWGVEYYNLAKTVFPASFYPHFIEGAEYASMNFSFCARRGVVERKMSVVDYRTNRTKNV